MPAWWIREAHFVKSRKFIILSPSYHLSASTNLAGDRGTDPGDGEALTHFEKRQTEENHSYIT